MIAVLLSFSPAILLAAGCGGSSGASTASQAEITAALTTKLGPVTKEAVQEVVDRRLGRTGFPGEPLTRNIVLTPEAGGTFVDISLNRLPCSDVGLILNCAADQLPGDAAEAAQRVMSVLFNEYSGISRVRISLYGTTLQDQNRLAVKIMITKADAAKIDWASLSEKNAPKLASYWWTDPSV